MAARLEEQSFDRCDAAPQFRVDYELAVFIQLHMDDLRGAVPRLAVEQIQTNPRGKSDSERGGQELRSCTPHNS